MPRMTRGRGSRHTGTSAPVARAASCSARIAERDAVGPGEQAQRRRGVGRAAAQSRRDRQPLVEA